MAERFMQSLNNSLAILSRHHPSDWHKFVPGVAFAYNTSVHASTGASPFFLNTGRVPSFPEEGWIKDWAKSDEDLDYTPSLYKAYVQELVETIQHAQGHARQAMEAAWMRQSRQFKPDSKKIAVGDQVLVRLTDAERAQFPIRKLAPRWSEPSVVREVLTNGKTFRIERNGDLITVNRERLTRLPPLTRPDFVPRSAVTPAEEKRVWTEDSSDESDDAWPSPYPALRSNMVTSAVRTDLDHGAEGAPSHSASTQDSGVEVQVSSSSAGPPSSGVPSSRTSSSSMLSDCSPVYLSSETASSGRTSSTSDVTWVPPFDSS